MQDVARLPGSRMTRIRKSTVCVSLRAQNGREMGRVDARAEGREAQVWDERGEEREK